MQTIPELYERIKKESSLKEVTKEFQKEILEYALIKHYGNMTQAAKTLKADRIKLTGLIKCKI